jgi:outer membrane protein, multidrug efflux system
MTAALRFPLALAAAALALAGCATPRLPSTPSEPAPPAWQATLPHGGDAAALAAWWQRFDDPLVAELVRDAQAANPTLAQALARLAEARAGVRSSQALRWPSVNASAQALAPRAPRSPPHRRAASRPRSAGTRRA